MKLFLRKLQENYKMPREHSVVGGAALGGWSREDLAEEAVFES